jgi:hypothetical protein
MRHYDAAAKKSMPRRSMQGLSHTNSGGPAQSVARLNNAIAVSAVSDSHCRPLRSMNYTKSAQIRRTPSSELCHSLSSARAKTRSADKGVLETSIVYPLLDETYIRFGDRRKTFGHARINRSIRGRRKIGTERSLPFQSPNEVGVSTVAYDDELNAKHFFRHELTSRQTSPKSPVSADIRCGSANGLIQNLDHMLVARNHLTSLHSSLSQ